MRNSSSMMGKSTVSSTSGGVNYENLLFEPAWTLKVHVQVVMLVSFKLTQAQASAVDEANIMRNLSKNPIFNGCCVSCSADCSDLSPS